ncbi:predicted protein [Enterococcus faecalis E1Sol]|nr:predicted protein [Enterococcus faecalis E1Sol]
MILIMSRKRDYRDIEKEFHQLMKKKYYPKQHNQKLQLLMDELKKNYDFSIYTEDTSRAIALHYHMSQKFQTDKPSLF